MTTTVSIKRADDEAGSDPPADCRYHRRCAEPCERLATEPGDHAELSRLACIRSFRRRDAIVYLTLTAVVTVLCFVGAYRYFFDLGVAGLEASASRELPVHVQRLERETDRFDTLLLALSMNRDVIAYLKGDHSRERSEAINDILRNLNDSTGALQTYLVDTSLHVVASSNPDGPGSFIGRDISYRPYVQRAQPGRVVGYYAVGTTGNMAGYYLAIAANDGAGRRVGIVATKIGLDRIEQDWLHGVERRVVVLDENGVVVLSSRADWKYRLTHAITDEERRRFDETQQYNRANLRPLAWNSVTPPFGDRPFVRAGLPGQERDYLAVTASLPELAMKLVVLADPSDAERLALAQAGFVAVMVALVALLAHIVYERRLDTHEQQLAREALEAAHERLKTRFERRSVELRIANEDLKQQVAERIESERRLRNYQDELIRTENLAVIGQLSAGLAHEINQPLAAMSTLSENAVRFLQRGDTATAQFNLGRISELVTRMGTLTGRLRSFARRSSGEIVAMPLVPSIENAVALLVHRLEKEHVAVKIEAPPEPLFAFGETVRLEQVLVNLLSNAIEAMEESAVREIVIRAYRTYGDGEHVFIDVLDNGIGLSDAVRERLFEPFFTTKKASGLGLGLAISVDIATSFGGSLTCENRPQGGALFRLMLRAAPSEGNASC
ncbi:sensor histidine kinase [Paraburkholderia kururiensis]|uniref:histidine kinase n=1 Tax=Paraburkholderia kururiensis TaxID=984307 RepID=A0ABZ0WR53_9BURK|nr:ATP-binding protein [Paraburkholderia kururiensis]WQD79890.1 ATP-binding protein [Paraburkholderia kururiensis]